jgi:hypothetical protein
MGNQALRMHIHCVQISWLSVPIKHHTIHLAQVALVVVSHQIVDVASDKHWYAVLFCATLETC